MRSTLSVRAVFLGYVVVAQNFFINNTTRIFKLICVLSNSTYTDPYAFSSINVKNTMHEQSLSFFLKYIMTLSNIINMMHEQCLILILRYTITMNTSYISQAIIYLLPVGPHQHILI